VAYQASAVGPCVQQVADDRDPGSLEGPRGPSCAQGRMRSTSSLCRSKSRRCSSRGVSVLFDETAEDPGAQQSVGTDVDGSRLLVGIGW
jgi:hypothetical protein